MRTSHGIIVSVSFILAGCLPAPTETAEPGGSGNGGGAEGGSSGGSSAGVGGSAGNSDNGGSSASSGKGGDSGGSAGSSGSGSGSAGNAGSSGTGGTYTIGLACSPGVPPTSQIPRMKSSAYDAVVRDLLGVTTLASAGNQPPSALLSPDSDGAITDIAWNGYLSAAEQIAAAVMAGSNKSKFISCDPSTESCLTSTIKTFGRKAFRRPLTDTEVQSFMRFNSLTPKGQPAEVAEAILYAFLASPSFILLPELAQDKEGNNIKLTSYEIATRLSFLLWGTIPDDQLSQAADSGQLATKEQIAAQAQRMLKSEKAKAVVANFVRYYAGIENSSHWVNNNSHDSSIYPAFTDASYAPAMAEIDAFFQDVVLNGGGFKDLFLSNNGFVTKDTAALYGLDASSYDTDLKKVALDASRRPGFLTRVGFLSTFSKYDVTSPILRGAFISGRVLGVDPGTPDPKFAKTPIPEGDYKTMREAIDALTINEPCHSCHGTVINPSGYVLEHYNSVGMWQDKDPLGGDIDGTDDVRFSARLTKTITNPLDMMKEIAALPEAKHHYAEQWVAFATGRVPNENDACTVAELSDNMAKDGYPLLSVIADFTQADSFRLRAVEN